MITAASQVPMVMITLSTNSPVMRASTGSDVELTQLRAVPRRDGSGKPKGSTPVTPVAPVLGGAIFTESHRGSFGGTSDQSGLPEAPRGIMAMMSGRTGWGGRKPSLLILFLALL